MTAPISEVNRASKTYDAGPPTVDQLSLTGWAAILASAAGLCRLAPPCQAGQRTEPRGF